MSKYFLSFHTIFIMNENIDWIEEFLKYHLAIGFEHFYLYDNEGSVGRNGSTETHNKYGFDLLSMLGSLNKKILIFCPDWAV